IFRAPSDPSDQAKDRRWRPKFAPQSSVFFEIHRDPRRSKLFVVSDSADRSSIRRAMSVRLSKPSCVALFALIAACAGACGMPASGDSANIESERRRRDGGVRDVGALDSGIPDVGIQDSGIGDAGVQDAGDQDSGAPDTGAQDSGVADAGTLDSGSGDTGGD